MKAPATFLLLLLGIFPCLMVADDKGPSAKDSKSQSGQRKLECPEKPSDVTVINPMPKPPPSGAESIPGLPCADNSTSGSIASDGHSRPGAEALNQNGGEDTHPVDQGNEPPGGDHQQKHEEGFPVHTDHSRVKGNESLQSPVKDAQTDEELEVPTHIQKEGAETPAKDTTATNEVNTPTLPITTQEPTTVTTEDPNLCRRRGFLKPWPKCSQETGQNRSQEIAEALTIFSLELFNQVLQTSSEPNVVFSPMSVALVLSHLLLGARGSTKELLLKNLFYLENDNSSNCVHSTLGKMVASQGFLSASGLFYRKDLTINEFFLEQSKEFYKITPEKFTDSQSRNLEMVNSWVEKHTNGKIKNILDELGEDVRLILVNAIFYMGKWINEFNPKDTKNAAFWGTEKKVKMMHSSKYPLVSFYDANLKARIGRFPLSDDMSMLILVPQTPSRNALFDLSDVLSSSQDIFLEVISKLDRSFVHPTMVSVPKFKVDSTLDLVNIFSGSALEQLFSGSNLCGISDSEDLMVSGGRHRAVLKMDEAGVTAAAATAVSLGRTAHMFDVDQPYIFIVWSERGKLPVMMGRITNPGI